MIRHDTVVFEEPPDPLFLKMLEGEVSIETYLETLDLEYPDFSRRLLETSCELHRLGKKLYQVEPFLQNLIEIHEHLAGGGRPADFQEETDLCRVYFAEKNATAALLDFYRTSIRGSFLDAVEAVKRFAHADAQRLALRDSMRAEALLEVLNGPGTHCIEAGRIHYFLFKHLKRRLPTGYLLEKVFLMADTFRDMGYRRHLFSPGDILTFIYLFHPQWNRSQEDLLAARTLIYNKLILKEEIYENLEAHPHATDELKTGKIIKTLSMEDCRRLYPLLRRVSTDVARERALQYLEQKKVMA